MRKYFIYMAAWSIMACGGGISKPDDLIPEDKMADILFDLYVIEGIRQSNPASFQQRKLEPSDYVFEKYKIDSLQFVDSDHWYAADTKRYQKLYEKVLAKADAEMKKNGAAKTTSSPNSLPPPARQQLEKMKKMRERARTFN